MKVQGEIAGRMRRKFGHSPELAERRDGGAEGVSPKR